MVPHAETLCRIRELEYEVLLRHAAQQRRAATALARSDTRPIAVQAALLAAAAWLTGSVARARGATGGHGGASISGDSVQVASQAG
jgi:hypothetical protein